jgi:hypothetical protein
VADEHPARLQARQEAARDEVVPAGRERPVDLPIDDGIAAVDEARRVAKGARVAFESPASLALVILARRCEVGAGRVAQASGFRDPSPESNGVAAGSRRTLRTARPSWCLKKNGTAMTVAMSAWKIKLPEPGSM